LCCFLQMLIEEFADVYGALAKANYPAGGASEKPAAYDALFAADGAAQKHLGNFNKVLAGKASFTSTVTAGELAVVAAISILKDLEPVDKLLAAFPDLAAFYAKHAAEADAALTGINPYFSRA
jgi:hypothetical protein